MVIQNDEQVACDDCELKDRCPDGVGCLLAVDENGDYLYLEDVD